ncbi:EF-hand domain-containing protein [Oleomonas cavernae]|nr:hypothetical protein [Oleomonas cavernae]
MTAVAHRFVAGLAALLIAGAATVSPALADQAPTAAAPAASAPPAGAPTADRHAAAKQARFKKLDADRDGVVTRAEFEAGSQMMIKRIADTKPDRVKAFLALPPAEQTARIDGSFARIDANHDGRIDAGEWQSGRAGSIIPRG